MGRRLALALGVAAGLAGVRDARAEPVPGGLVDRTAVRFLAPEMGGNEHPGFVLERTLAFEARLEAMAEGPDVAGYVERDVRNALEHDVAEQILVALSAKLVEATLPARRPKRSEIDAVVAHVVAARVERLGGRARIDAAAAAEHLEPEEVDAVLSRGGLAAWYLDRALTPLLHPSEEQLREVYRSNNPYRGQPFSEIRGALERWFVTDRIRVAEAAFLQAARAHVRIIVTR